MSRLWIDSAPNFTIGSGARSTASLMTGFSAGDTRFSQMTLLRTIIGLDVGATVHDFGEGSQVVSLGLGVTSQTAFTSGALPLPELVTSFPTKPWVWRAQYRVFGFAADQPTIFTRRIDLDIRAMRKLENGEAFLTVANGPLEGVAFSVDVVGFIRQLWLVS